MATYVKVPCTVLFSGPTNCGKTQLVLDLIENKSRKHYDDAIKKHSLLFSNNSALYTLIAYSVYCGWKRFINNVKVCALPTC